MVPVGGIHTWRSKRAELTKKSIIQKYKNENPAPEPETVEV